MNGLTNGDTIGEMVLSANRVARPGPGLDVGTMSLLMAGSMHVTITLQGDVVVAGRRGGFARAEQRTVTFLKILGDDCRFGQERPIDGEACADDTGTGVDVQPQLRFSKRH